MAAAEEKALQVEVDKLKADLAGRDQQIKTFEESLKVKSDELAASVKLVGELQAGTQAKDALIKTLKAGGDNGKAEAPKPAPELVTAEVTNKHTKALTIAGVIIPAGQSMKVEKFNPKAGVIKAWIDKGIISIE